MRIKNLTTVTSSPFDAVEVYGECHGFPNRENGILEIVLVGQLRNPLCY
jgi:hypothetical protein